MERKIRITESEIKGMVAESVKRIVEEYAKGMTWSFDGKGTHDCEMLVSPLDGYSVGCVNHKNKTVRPVHGYYYPNKRSIGLMKHALELGYTYEDPEMPDRINKTKQK